MSRTNALLMTAVASFASLYLSAPAQAEALAIKGKTVYTMAGPPIEDGMVFIRDGKIEAVGKAADIDLPEGCRIMDAAVVTPGLIDAHSTVGLTGYLNQRQDQEQIDHSEPIQPELRALDAYDPQERLIEWVRGFGITVLNTGHAPGEVISGQTMIVKTAGKTVDEVVMIPTAMIAATLGDGSVKGGGRAPGTRSKAVAMLRAELMRAQAYLKKQEAAEKSATSAPAEAPANGESTDPASAKGEPPSGGAPDPTSATTGPADPNATGAADPAPPAAGEVKPPSGDSSQDHAAANPATTEPAGEALTPPNGEAKAETTDEPASAETSQADADAAGDEKKKKKDPPERDLRREAMVRVLKGEVPLLVNVHRAADIVTTLRLAKEFNIRVILDGASEAYLVRDEIKAAGVPVILHPTMMRSGKGPTENASMETATILKKAGIPFALQSGFESYVPKTRVVLFEAGVAAANGLLFEDALASITINAAKILGIDARVGSLEVGKDGDVALYDGDPFEYTTHCTGTVINGVVVSQERR